MAATLQIHSLPNQQSSNRYNSNHLQQYSFYNAHSQNNHGEPILDSLKKHITRSSVKAPVLVYTAAQSNKPKMCLNLHITFKYAT